MNRRFVGWLALTFVFVVLGCTGAGATVWTVETIATDAWLANNISLMFSGNQLLLNNSYIFQPGGSSANSRTLHMSGTWGVYGSISGGKLVRDPYAEFIISAYSVPEYEVQYDQYGALKPYEDAWTVIGRTVWQANTPSGYVATLLLGAGFSGDGSVTYSYQNPHWSREATGTMVLESNYRYVSGYHNVSNYSALDSGFWVSYPTGHAQLIPEGSVVILALFGLAAVGGRRRVLRRLLSRSHRAR